MRGKIQKAPWGASVQPVCHFLRVRCDIFFTTLPVETAFTVTSTSNGANGGPLVTSIVTVVYGSYLTFECYDCNLICTSLLLQHPCADQSWIHWTNSWFCVNSERWIQTCRCPSALCSLFKLHCKCQSTGETKLPEPTGCCDFVYSVCASTCSEPFLCLSFLMICSNNSRQFSFLSSSVINISLSACSVYVITKFSEL